MGRVGTVLTEWTNTSSIHLAPPQQDLEPSGRDAPLTRLDKAGVPLDSEGAERMHEVVLAAPRKLDLLRALLHDCTHPSRLTFPLKDGPIPKPRLMELGASLQHLVPFPPEATLRATHALLSRG